MKLSKILSGFLGLFLLIFLILSVSAITTPYGKWADNSFDLTISNGANADFNFYFSSTDPEMTMSIEFFPMGSIVPLKTFPLDPTLNHSYSNDAPYTITSSDYSGIGDYTLKFSSSDQLGPLSTWDIKLHVVNDAPVLPIIPDQSINELTAYTYDVNATDANGDTLTYSLTSAPAWLSINSGNGIITGTAPQVAVSTPISITVQVSDSLTTTSRTYTLTILDGAPIVTLNPPAIQTWEAGTPYVDAGATALDVEDGIIPLGPNFLITFNNVNTAVLGTYSVIWAATDSNGNIGTATRTVIVQDTTVPTVTLNGDNPLTITQGGTYVEAGALVTDNYDATYTFLSPTGTVNTSVIGPYILTYTVTDTQGNIAPSITRTVNVVAPGSGSSSSSGSSNVVYSSTDVSQDEDDYLDGITSPPINIGGKKSQALSIWILLLILVIILIIVLGSAIIFLIKDKKVLE